jgi:hypothetical protein
MSISSAAVCRRAMRGIAIVRSFPRDYLGLGSGCACADDGELTSECEEFLFGCDVSDTLQGEEACLGFDEAESASASSGDVEAYCKTYTSGLLLAPHIVRLIISSTIHAPSRSMGRSATPVQLLLAVRRMAQECLTRAMILIARILLKEKRGTYALTISPRHHGFSVPVTTSGSLISIAAV